MFSAFVSVLVLVLFSWKIVCCIRINRHEMKKERRFWKTLGTN